MSRFYEHICPHIQSTFQNLDKCLSAFPLSTRSPPLFVPSPVHLPHLHPLCPLLLYLPLFCSSTRPRIVHLSDPVTLAAGRLIASTPTGLYITLLSAPLDQIALTVNHQTPWDSRLHSHECTCTHTQQITTSLSLLSPIIFNFCILVPSPCLLVGISVSAVSCLCLRLIDEALDQMQQMMFVPLFIYTL